MMYPAALERISDSKGSLEDIISSEAFGFGIPSNPDRISIRNSKSASLACQRLEAPKFRETQSGVAAHENAQPHQHQ
jgi:hypothetical protein